MAVNQNQYRFSERVFRRYEPVIKRMLASFDKPFQAKFEGSTETHTARFRDAARSFIDHKWESEADPEEFRKLWQVSAVRTTEEDGGFLVFNKREHKQMLLDMEAPTHELDSTVDLGGTASGFTNPLTDEIDALLVLAGHDRFSNQPLRLVDLTPEVIIHLQTRVNDYPNLMLDQIDNTTFILL